MHFCWPVFCYIKDWKLICLVCFRWLSVFPYVCANKDLYHFCFVLSFVGKQIEKNWVIFCEVLFAFPFFCILFECFFPFLFWKSKKVMIEVIVFVVIKVYNRFQCMLRRQFVTHLERRDEKNQKMHFCICRAILCSILCR